MLFTTQKREFSRNRYVFIALLKLSTLSICLDVQYVPRRMIRILDSANVVVIIGES